MTGKQWLWLFFFYIAYLLLGSFVFIALEEQNDLDEKYKEELESRNLAKAAIETLTTIQTDAERDSVQDLLQKIEEVRGPVLPQGFNLTREIGGENSTLGEEEDIDVVHHWDLWNTFYFSFITITTIGYGHIYPKTGFGQQFCIIYSLFGIPLNTLVFVTLSTFYKDLILREEDKKEEPDERPVHILVLRAVMYMIPGLLVFLLLPSILFSIVEGWNYPESVYFAFISLTTIGYGEYVAGHPDHFGGWDFVYKIFIMLWTIFGLSYIIMVVGFLMNALTSTHVRDARKTTTKRVSRIIKLLRQFSKKEDQKIEQEQPEGVDNIAFTITEGKENSAESITDKRKTFRRKMSVVEMMLPQNQRMDNLRKSSISTDNSSKCGKVLKRNISQDSNNVKLVRELLDAVKDLLDNEFAEEMDNDDQSQDTSGECVEIKMEDLKSPSEDKTKTLESNSTVKIEDLESPTTPSVEVNPMDSPILGKTADAVDT